MILEMHSHTSEHSVCSRIDAVSLVQAVHNMGFEGIVLTDHHYLWMPEEMEDLRRRAGIPEYFIILAGQEVATSDAGHVLVYGAERTLSEKTPLPAIRQEFPEAAIVWAHPYRNGHKPSPEGLTNPYRDAVEIFSSNHTVVELNRGVRDWHRHKFAATGGTDAHSTANVGRYPTIFEHPVKSIGDLAAEIRAGRCRPLYKEITRSRAPHIEVVELVIGLKGANKVRENLVIKRYNRLDAWERGNRTSHILKELGRYSFHGGKFRVPRPLGSDAEELVLIEEGVRGRTLFERVLRADVEHARFYLQLAAQWLANLHNMKLQITPPDEFMETEPHRLAHYVSNSDRIDPKHARRISEITNHVLEAERVLYLHHPERMVQGHGDYHPKNLFIGQDNPDDSESSYISAVDFDDSYCMPPAFDVGTFITQFRSQFFHHRDVLKTVNEDFFLATYLQYAEDAGDDFLAQVELFKARASLSIIYFLIKIGLGDSENLWRILVEAEHSLTSLSIHESHAEFRAD
ncbi:MAG: phosphotransferase [Candidatus Abyssobacteria bacterium SURF_5]|uniref:Phosphotransferase n=1 Tax=Abyssobacteria bacterium (strain SURF_5) TaxID=2093360 RepID=A0A3A4NVI9_ABYX5|nr:MAG: phosphotransferase [Candidatus Abyssubacteria bacterium SURF_5]